MNHIILSIRPEWLAKILNGEKTVEIRKTVPKLPCTVWLYCTKAEPILLQAWGNAMVQNCIPRLNGQIVAKFTLEKAEEFDASMGNPRIYTKACIQDEEAFGYAKGKPLWAWHIANLTILDKPLALGDFYHSPSWAKNEFANVLEEITRSPQSWQYCTPKGELK